MPESQCGQVQCYSGCCVASAFSTALKLIWKTSSLKTTKMSKKCIFCKKEAMGSSWKKDGSFFDKFEKMYLNRDQKRQKFCKIWTWGFFVNPLTPVPPVTGHDKPWPFLHFWCHHFWPKLASTILNFCRRKRTFQWCPDPSDLTNGAWDMHKNV